MTTAVVDLGEHQRRRTRRQRHRVDHLRRRCRVAQHSRKPRQPGLVRPEPREREREIVSRTAAQRVRVDRPSSRLLRARRVRAAVERHARQEARRAGRRDGHPDRAGNAGLGRGVRAVGRILRRVAKIRGVAEVGVRSGRHRPALVRQKGPTEEPRVAARLADERATLPRRQKLATPLDVVAVALEDVPRGFHVRGGELGFRTSGALARQRSSRA